MGRHEDLCREPNEVQRLRAAQDRRSRCANEAPILGVSTVARRPIEERRAERIMAGLTGLYDQRTPSAFRLNRSVPIVMAMAEPMASASRSKITGHVPRP